LIWLGGVPEGGSSLTNTGSSISIDDSRSECGGVGGVRELLELELEGELLGAGELGGRDELSVSLSGSFPSSQTVNGSVALEDWLLGACELGGSCGVPSLTLRSLIPVLPTPDPVSVGIKFRIVVVKETFLLLEG
jgi:hypothetical protein